MLTEKAYNLVIGLTKEEEKSIFDQAMDEMMAYEQEILDHNNAIIEQLAGTAREDFEELCVDTDSIGKIEIVEKPEGMEQYAHDENETFKVTHVLQWSTNMEGDSFSGKIYAQIKAQKGKWLKIPYSC